VDDDVRVGRAPHTVADVFTIVSCIAAAWALTA
jgi:hypothetical protein